MPKTFFFLDEQKLIIGSIEVLLNYPKKKKTKTNTFLRKFVATLPLCHFPY